MDLQEKTPEIDVSYLNKKSLKIWAHNFEKQKSYNIFKLSKSNRNYDKNVTFWLGFTLNFILGLICMSFQHYDIHVHQ